MDKDMQSANTGSPQKPIGKLRGTGIILRVINKDTGERVNYGVQLNNTTLEIEALPNLNVSLASKEENNV